MSPSVLVSAFRKSGIYPLDRKQISNERLLCSEQSSSETGSPQPTLSSKNTSGAVQAFEALEAVLTTPSRTKYRRRMAEGYDLEGSPTFSVWQKLYRATEDPVIPSEANLQGTTAACTTTELEKIPTNLWSETTDEKRGERVRTIAGLPIGRVPRGLFSCFWDLLGNADVECIEWYVNFQNNFYANLNYFSFSIMCTKKYI